jgi:RimJ/RimL family protein N-acetyltransferase
MDLASAAAPLPRSPQEPPTLRTARLVLRPLDLGDEEWVAELASHRSIGRNTLSIPHPYPPGAALRFLEQVRSGYPRTGSCAFAVIVDETGEKAGAAGLTVDSRNRKAELGYWIGQPYWGRGYATEAAAGLLPLGFETLGLKRIFARVFGSNPASARVLEKIGLQFEGRLRGHLLKWGEFEDILMYGLLREEWTGDSGMTVPKPLAGR